MSMSKRPALRFKGFTEAWEQYTVDEIANRYDNMRIPVAANLRVPGTTPYYGANGIQDYVDGFTHEGEFVLVAEDGANDLKNYPVRCVNGKIWVNNHAHVLQGKQEIADNRFLTYSINHANIESLLVGGGRAKLNAETLMLLNLDMPDVNEQQSIGHCLEQVDNLIVLHQRKYDKLLTYKKAMLEKMFPKDGTDVPEVRFVRVDNAWHKATLADAIVTLIGGVSITPDDYRDEGIRTVPKGAVNDSGQADLSGSKFVDRLFFQQNSTKSVRNHQIVTSLRDLVASAPNMGRIVRIVGDDEYYLMPQGVYRIQVHNNIDEDFLIAYSNSYLFRKYVTINKSGSTQVHLRNADFLSICMYLPDYNEQCEIGKFFKKLNERILLQQMIIEKQKTIKKALMERMFI